MRLSATLPTRVEAGDVFELRAEVQDRETLPNALLYTWSTPVGGAFVPIIDSLREVRWTAPAGQPPQEGPIRLSATETYLEDGVQKTHQVALATSSFHYNDSPADVLRISTRFITQLFADFAVTPEQAVQDFSDNCPGKREERLQVEGNRKEVRILSGSFTDAIVLLNPDKTRADVAGLCVFRDIPNAGPNAGLTERVEGVCRLTAVYEQWNWRLCDSNFDALDTSVETLRFRTPGLR